MLLEAQRLLHCKGKQNVEHPKSQTRKQASEASGPFWQPICHYADSKDDLSPAVRNIKAPTPNGTYAGQPPHKLSCQSCKGHLV
eukprot:379321-Amphidinium_carterae.2